MIRPYVEKQIALIRPYITGKSSLLDYGCGDLSLAKGLKKLLPDIRITGVDVVDSGVRAQGIDFRIYNGKWLPFDNASFDATVVYHVFHHCADPKSSLADVMRVTKKTIIMVEPIWRYGVDLFFMKIMDRVGNGWRGEAIPMPFTFQKEEMWVRWAREYKWKIHTITSAGVLPSWLPIGVTKLFVMNRNMS